MYQYWRHANGDTYAVEVQGDKLMGICGPLHYTEYQQDDLLPDYDYQDEDVAWAETEDMAGRWTLVGQREA